MVWSYITVFPILAVIVVVDDVKGALDCAPICFPFINNVNELSHAILIVTGVPQHLPSWSLSDDSWHLWRLPH